MREVLEIKKNPQLFQILFLRNDKSQKVEVQEVKEVDFIEVQDHLQQGESVFITSKRSQKLKAPKQKTKPNRLMKTRMLEAFYLDHV